MLNILFFTPVVLYFAAMVLQFAGAAFKHEKLQKAAWFALVAGAAVQTAYIVVRGVRAGRVPLANQFEFANAFAWGTAVMGIFFKIRGKKSMDFMVTLCAPCAFLLISYAALQPREITELMPALRSAWFTIHIGAAVFSYAAFAVAAAVGVRYLALEKKETEQHLRELDTLGYKLVSFGFLMLTIVILTGCIWAEQAWGSFWTWDPKEVWALITWIVYAVYLHLRLRRKLSSKVMAWIVVIAVPVVLFTFVGVNTLLPGLHSYG